MLDTSRVLYSYNDVMIKPAQLSVVSSRSECDPYLSDGFLPIFTAPMSTVVDLNNRAIFENNHINTILPRNISFDIRYQNACEGKWSAFSLKEFSEHFANKTNVIKTVTPIKALIDIANGHMDMLYDLVFKSKNIYGNNIKIMIGNIANPETYESAYESGVDFVRCSIGSGEGCITSTSASIHYPIASLLDDIYKIKKKIIQEWIDVYVARSLHPVPTFETPLSDIIDKLPKIIADGGIRGYGDVIKALALGADYVMIGGLFASLIESAGTICTLNEDGTLNERFEDQASARERIDQYGLEGMYKEFYGMASREGQIDINGIKTKTAEGTKKYLPITGSVDQWSKNMADYLKSAMSYCDVKNIKDFNADNVETILISNNTKNSINR